MREHMGLYRGKRKDNGEWVEGAYARTKRHHCIITGYIDDMFVVYGHYAHHVEMYIVAPDTVGECTGLQANGKLIFEGDICRVTRHCILAYGKITYRRGCFWFEEDETGSLLRLCDIELNGFKIEIIGNIHDNDNPELVKGAGDDETRKSY